MILPRVFPLLAAAPTVTAFIGTNPVRAYPHGEASQDVAKPYVTWSAPGGAPDNGFDGAMADFFRVQIDCWADLESQIDPLAEAVRAALEPHAHLVAYLADERDPVTKRYRISFAFDFITAR